MTSSSCSEEKFLQRIEVVFGKALAQKVKKNMGGNLPGNAEELKKLLGKTSRLEPIRVSNAPRVLCSRPKFVKE